MTHGSDKLGQPCTLAADDVPVACPIGRSTPGTCGHSRTALHVGSPANRRADPLHRAAGGLLVALRQGRGSWAALDADAPDLGIPAPSDRGDRVEDDLLDVGPRHKHRRPTATAVATGPYAGEGFDCPALDTLFLAAPVANKGSLTQYVGRILRSHENKTTAEVHDYLDERTGVLAAMLAKRAPGYTGLGFSDPRRLPLTPSASTDN
jgi:hypothetical protein